MNKADENLIFDSAWYLAEYPDVAMSGMDPFAHYEWIGRTLGRHPRNPQQSSSHGIVHQPHPDAHPAPAEKKSSIARFFEPEPLKPGEAAPALSPLMRYIWDSRPDLQAAFDLKTEGSRQDFINWIQYNLPETYGLPLMLGKCPQGLRDDGVNLIGYARSPSGMGEHVRMVAHAFASNEVPFALKDITVGSGGDNSIASWISEACPFQTNIFHVNADMYPIEALKYGYGHYNIGYWAWELAKCPPSFDTALQLVDEIWGISEFVSDALRMRASVPVHTLPLAVKVPDLSPSARRKARFGLEEEPFTFLFTFDAASYLDRKNPVDAVRAFKQAFPRGDENVRLVLKTHNVSKTANDAYTSFLWSQLLNEIGDSTRIHIIDRSFDRDETFALTAACDAFISLHRSEGFGRNLAEAMAYGRPVIATGYSGSNEFIRKDSAIPINYTLIPVREGAYPQSEGQCWAQPDIEHAAWAMRLLVEDNSRYQEIAVAGQALIRDQFNEKVIGRRYAERLSAMRAPAHVKIVGSSNIKINDDVIHQLNRHVSEKDTVLFTIVSCNYMAFALTVLQSVRKQHPEFSLFICLVDEEDNITFPDMNDFHVIRVRDMGLPDFIDMRIRYDVMELNTAVKPFFIDFIYSQTNADKVIYFDPDLFLYRPLHEVIGALNSGHSAVLTPHINQPIEDDGCSPCDHSMLQAGVFNLGFIATRRTDETRRFIKWWARQLQTAAISDIRNNLFTDQRWCDLAPCFLPALKVLHHPGHNVAYWNLDQRNVERLPDHSVIVNGEPLVFFHFSGFHPRKIEDVSKHQTRFTWDNISETTRDLMKDYAKILLENDYDNATKSSYSYNEIDGYEIRPIVRHLYRETYPSPQSFQTPRDARKRLEALSQEVADVVPGDGGKPFTRLMMQIYHSRPDVQAAFPISSPEGAQSFRNWFATSASAEYGLKV